MVDGKKIPDLSSDLPPCEQALVHVHDNNSKFKLFLNTWDVWGLGRWLNNSFATLAEELDSVPSTHMVAYNLLQHQFRRT